MFRMIAALALLLAANSAASARPVHIVAFGDSATAGWLVPHKDAYPAQLQALLRKRGFDVVVGNAGINGGTFLDALLHFDEAIAPDTDIAIVEFGTNDLRGRASMKTVRARLAELIHSLRARRIEVLVIGLGKLDLSDVARSNGVLYAQWTLPPGKYRARDHAHYNAAGYAIVVRQMLPLLETLISRVSPR
jgi:acyl-CoA thioesterase-1